MRYHETKYIFLNLETNIRSIDKLYLMYIIISYKSDPINIILTTNYIPIIS